jgi:hypothetical protein
MNAKCISMHTWVYFLFFILFSVRYAIRKKNLTSQLAIRDEFKAGRFVETSSWLPRTVEDFPFSSGLPVGSFQPFARYGIHKAFRRVPENGFL